MDREDPWDHGVEVQTLVQVHVDQSYEDLEVLDLGIDGEVHEDQGVRSEADHLAHRVHWDQGQMGMEDLRNQVDQEVTDHEND